MPFGCSLLGVEAGVGCWICDVGTPRGVGRVCCSGSQWSTGGYALPDSDFLDLYGYWGVCIENEALTALSWSFGTVLWQACGGLDGG